MAYAASGLCRINGDSNGNIWTYNTADAIAAAAADAARRAVLDSSPLPLPKGKENKFQNFIFDFNTSFINDY